MSDETELDIKLGVSIEGLQEGIEQAKEAIESLGEPIKGIVDAFSELGEAFLAALAVEKIEEFADHMGELGERTERMSKILGISTEQVSELNFAAAMTGTSTENLALMMGRFESSLGEAAKGTGRVAEGLKALGLSTKELQGLPLQEQLEKIADATSKFADSANKTAALASLGRGFVELIPLLDEGGRGFEELSERAKEAGVVLDEEMTGRLVDMQHALVNLHQTVQGLTTGAFAPFINVVNGAVALLTDIAHSMMESTKEGGVLHDVLGLLASVFQNLEQFIGETILIFKDFNVAGQTAANALGAAFQGFGKVVADVFQALAKALPEFFTALETAGAEAVKAVEQQFIDLGTVIGDTLKLNFSGAKVAFDQMGTDAGASAAKIGGAFKGVFDFSAADADAKKTTDQLAKIIDDGNKQIIENAKVAQQEYNRIWGIGSDKKEAEAPKLQVPNLQATGTGNKDAAFKAAEEESAAEIKLYSDAAAQKESILDGELKRREISTAQWLAGTKDALQDELQDTIATYQAELATANLTAQQRKAISDKIAEAEAANAVKVVKAEQKAADESAKAWQEMFKGINSAFESQIDKLLSGTESWHTAMRNVLKDLIEQFAKFGIDKLLTGGENLLGGALGIGGQGVGVGTFGGNFGSSPSFGGGDQSIVALAANTAATLANTIATNAAAVAQFFHIPGFATGSWELPGDMVAQVHKGEMIVPAGQAAALRSAWSGGGESSGGGDTYHTHNNKFGDIHVHNSGGQLDPATVMKAVKQAFKNGAHLPR